MTKIFMLDGNRHRLKLSDWSDTLCVEFLPFGEEKWRIKFCFWEEDIKILREALKYYNKKCKGRLSEGGGR